MILFLSFIFICYSELTLEDLDARLRNVEMCSISLGCEASETDLYYPYEAGTKCGYWSKSRTFKLGLTSLENCAKRCEQDERCQYFSVSETAALCIGCAVVPTDDEAEGFITYALQDATTDTRTDQCLAGEAMEGSTTPPVFGPLTGEEMEEIFSIMLEAGLIDTTMGEKPSLTNNYVYGMAVEPPLKEDVLQGSSSRYADVHIHRGIENDIAEYIVGPLGSDYATASLRSTANYNARPRDGIEWDEFEVKVFEVYDVLESLIRESFDGAFTGDGLYFHPQAPPGLNAEDRETRFCAALTVPGMARGRDMHFLPLTGTVHNPGQDTSTWYAHSLYYLNQGPFENAEALLEAYNNGAIRKVAFPSGYRDDILERTMPQPLLGGLIDGYRANSEMPGPTLTSPPEKRFSVDGHKIEYLGWSFEIGASQYKGPAVFDVKFMGHKIAHEIALSEVGVVYSGDASSGSNTVYLDSTFGVGEFSDAIPGVDCPKYATLLKASWFNSYSQSAVVANSICVFEMWDGSSLWRRRDKFASGMRGHKLVVRIPMAVGNYDYIVSFEFMLDGKLRVDSTASGFLQTMYWDKENPLRPEGANRDPFGYRVSDYTHGSMHDHSIGWKVDLDVLGTDNTFKTMHWKAGSPEEAFNSQEGINISEKPSYFLYDETRYFVEEVKSEEVGLNINLAEPKFWVVQNSNEMNSWGNEKGYRIVPDMPASQVLVDHPSMKALGYTKYHAMVTKRHENERHLTGNYDLNQLAEAEIDASTWLNDENIENEDLVVWLNVAFNHLPTSEDVPITPSIGAGFTLKPFNFFDMTQAFDLPSYVDTSPSAPVHIHTREPVAEDCVSDTSQPDYFET